MKDMQHIFETVFHLDVKDDIAGLLQFAQNPSHDPNAVLHAIHHLLSSAKVRAAFILAVSLSNRGYKSPVLAIALTVGGLVHDNPSQTQRGLDDLHLQMSVLSLEQRIFSYDHIIVPILALLRTKTDLIGTDQSVYFLTVLKDLAPHKFDWNDMPCKVCHEEAPYIFQAQLLRKYDVSYYCCKACGFLFTEKPFWLEEAYHEAIAIEDTGIVARNLWLRDLVSVLLWDLFDHDAKFLDYGGGYGLFVRLMRDVGFDFYWEDRYCKNLFARGFEEKQARFELITAFECFEHFVDPVQELDQMLEKSDNILFTTSILPKPIPKPNAWWYYALEGGQHIAFYSIQSLQKLAASRGLNFLSDGTSVHMFSKKNIANAAFQASVKKASPETFRQVQSLTKSKVWQDHLYIKNIDK